MSANNMILQALLELKKTEKHRNYINILRNLHDAGMLDDETYREKLKTMAKLDDFKVNDEFWTKELR